jgi:L-rhamnose mutarotase
MKQLFHQSLFPKPLLRKPLFRIKPALVLRPALVIAPALAVPVPLPLVLMLLLYSLPVACHSPESPSVRRFGMVTGIKPDKIAYYEQLHAAIWPAVLREIRLCHIRNYSIYIQQIGDSSFLFSYFEYTGSDFTGDMQKMARDSATRRWWKETDPMQLPLPQAAARKEIWMNMREVFHAD